MLHSWHPCQQARTAETENFIKIDDVVCLWSGLFPISNWQWCGQGTALLLSWVSSRILVHSTHTVQSHYLVRLGRQPRQPKRKHRQSLGKQLGQQSEAA